MKCDKCGCDDFFRAGDCESQCSRCGMAYAESDFRAFRRQVLLALITGDYYRTMEIKRIWDDADRIARAEPKGE